MSSDWSPNLGKLVLTLGQGNAFINLGIVVITLLNVVVYKLRQIWEENSGGNDRETIFASPERLCRQFSLAEIVLATNNFDQALVIGKGGFGKVYKGFIDRGTTCVAIKRSDCKSNQGASEFWTEIEMLSKFRHIHIVSLIGYCNESDEMILVYEYVSGGNLLDHLCGTGSYAALAWVQRLKICIGTARGLDYLHTGTGAQTGVIHRDVKSSNILLDENCVAKVSDLGVAKIGPVNQQCTHVSTIVKGSFGYFDPDYFMTSRLTRKSDVYSFGVVLFEVLCGRAAVDLSLEEDQQGLVGWVQQGIKEGILDQYIDSRIKGQIHTNCLTIFVQIASRCLLKRPQERPTMSEVTVSLESALAFQERNSVIREIRTCNPYEKQEKAKANLFTRRKAIFSSRDGHSGQIFSFSRRRIFPENLQGVSVDGAEQPLRKEKRNSQNNFSFVLPNKDLLRYAGEKPSKKEKRKRQNFFSFVLPNKVLSRYVDEKPSRKKKGNSRFLFSCVFPNKDLLENEEDVIQEVPPSLEFVDQSLKEFTFAELRSATRNFSSVMLLGQGGFGSVFLGWIEKDMCTTSSSSYKAPVAVKKIDTESQQNFREWQTEVNILGQHRHSNITDLIGYCSDGKELLLVYEYLRKGSLDSWMFIKGFGEALSWATRLKIMIGVARAVAFLHTREKQIIHCDIKTSNILLDGDMNAQLADFGLAKFGPTYPQTHISTVVKGTYGYVDPEYMVTGRLCAKSDVYGFGVVLLELLTGQRAFDCKRSEKKQSLVDWTTPILQNKKKLKTIVDPRLRHYPQEGAFHCAALVLECIRSRPSERPSMEEVLQTLEQISAMKP